MASKENKSLADVVFYCNANVDKMEECRFSELDSKGKCIHAIDLKLKTRTTYCGKPAACKDAVANRRMSDYAKRVITV